MAECWIAFYDAGPGDADMIIGVFRRKKDAVAAVAADKKACREEHAKEKARRKAFGENTAWMGRWDDWKSWYIQRHELR